MDLSILQRLNSARLARRPCVTVTDIGTGTSHLYDGGEPLWPSDLATQIQDRLASGKSGVVVSGNRSLFIRAYLPPVKLVIIGAVHIAQALVPMATQLEYATFVVDPRTLFATDDRFPTGRVVTEWPHKALPEIGVDGSTAFVALTHDPKLDDDALAYVLRKGCFYVGALGSRKTHAKRVARLLGAGFTQSELDTIRAPIGLSIGASTPAEIAVSIIAEIVAAWNDKRVGAGAGT